MITLLVLALLFIRPVRTIVLQLLLGAMSIVGLIYVFGSSAERR